MTGDLAAGLASPPPYGATAVAWLGQAGLLIRTTAGRVIVIDPYLSNDCEEFYGLTRRVDPPIRADELQPDIVLITHWHEDHLDRRTVRSLAREGTVAVGPRSCTVRLRACGIHESQLRTLDEGEEFEISGVRIRATPARHQVPGYLTEDAVGFLIAVDGLRIFNVGDSEYDRRLVLGEPLDLCVLPINGTGGNMDANEAAFLASRLDCAAVMPVHFGMWSPGDYGPDATLDPAVFAAACTRFGGRGRVLIPSIGELVELPMPSA